MPQAFKNIRIVTWNVCLGSKCKISIIKDFLNENEIDVLCLQEVEIKPGEGIDEYEIQNYCIELENTSAQFKIRTMMYINRNIGYRRLHSLERPDTHLIFVHLLGPNVYVASLYRTYQLTVHLDHLSAFNEQIETLTSLFEGDKKIILLGDFNLDQLKRNDPTYHHSRLYETWKAFETEQQLLQLVDFPTWAREVQGAVKTSILDHIYVNDSSLVDDINELSIETSDHCPVMATMSLRVSNVKQKVWMRNWKNYTKENLLENLELENWSIRCINVEDFYDEMEQKIMRAFNTLVPLEEKTIRNNVYENQKISDLKRKRKNLYKNAKRRQNIDLFVRCKLLSKRIREVKSNSKRKKIRRMILEGGAQGLWQGYKLAEDKPRESLPSSMFCSTNEFSSDASKAQAFANFFTDKVKKITTETGVNPDIDNGPQRVQCESMNFFTTENVTKAMCGLKNKRCYGYDNIPVTILKDGAALLAPVYCKLLNLIYEQKTVPEKWRTARTIPVFKKGARNKIENYRPISNLCASSKIFERLILERLLQVEKNKQLDLSGITQHGFKKNRSTITASLELQNQIAKAMDEDNYVAVASMDLSAAFDVIDVNLLLKRMKNLGIPEDVLNLIKAWLDGRIAYVEVGSECSEFYKIDFGSGQGSILGPVLFNYYMAPFVSTKNVLTYADDNYQLGIHKNKEAALKDLQKRVIEAEQWMSGSGLKVNVEKTELVVFHRIDTGRGQIKIGSVTIESQQSMNVLGIRFDSRLAWDLQVDSAILKSRKKLHAMRRLRKFFTEKEMIGLLTANVFSRLYYGSQVWLLPNLKERLFKKLFSHSGQILKLIDNDLSYMSLHKKFNRSTPKIFSIYQTAINLYHVKNNIPLGHQVEIEQITLQNRRNCRATFVRANRFKVGLNVIKNRLRSITNIIDKTWLDLPINTFKLQCKIRIIQNSLLSM